MMLLTRRSLTAALGFAAVPGFALGQGGAQAFSEIEQKAGGRLGVAVLDEAGRTLALHRADERFLFCSTFKVYLAGAILANVDRGRERLDQRIELSRANVLPHSPTVEQALAAGGATVEGLCAGTVGLSDNGAANLLLDRVGGPSGLTAFFATLGSGEARLDRKETALNVRDGDNDTVTPAAAAAMLRQLLSRDVLTAPSRARLEQWLVESPTGRNRLRARWPADRRAGDKTGTGPSGETHDVGFVDLPGRGRLFIAAYYEGSKRPLPEREAVLAAVGEAAFALTRA